MTKILEVAIGLVFVFTFVSLLCSIFNEWIAGILSKRGRMLWEGIEKMVTQGMANDLCNHQLMQGLVREKTLFDKILFFINRSKPSYVPTQTFVTTLLAVVGDWAAVKPLAAGAPIFPAVADLRTAIQGGKLPRAVVEALLALTDDAGTIEKAKENIGHWFDAGMDTVSGWYKRWSQISLLIIGFLVAGSLGVDSLSIGRALWLDPVLSAATADAAGKFVTSHPNLDGLTQRELEKQIAGLQIPLYPWSQGTDANHVLGFALTALAASLGAPFWFDLLNKLVNLRAGSKPPEVKKAP